MRELVFILTIFVGLTIACNSTDSKTNSSSTSRLVSGADILERLKFQKANIDTLFNHSKDRLIVMAKLVDKTELIKIKNGNFPDNVETTFNILKDSSGNIITASEFPFSESGDWSITFTHYFDMDGKTFAFERQTNFFNSICTDGVAYETKTEFYNDTFVLIGNDYILVDQKHQPLPKDSCVFNYDRDYKVLPYIDKFLKEKNIKNGL